MLHLATSVARPNLVSLGTCFGKFSKSGKFKLGITSLDWLAKYAKYKVGPDVFSFHLEIYRALRSCGDGRDWLSNDSCDVESLCESALISRSGSNPQASSLFCMATTSSKHTWGV